MNPLQKLAEFGQAPWLDDIHRQLITDGELARLIEQDGLRGITSNPVIFNKAIGESEEYQDDIRAMSSNGKSPKEVCEALMVKDVRMAADAFNAVFKQSGGEHGYVSIEVNPHLARDAEATVQEARRLWKSVDRQNVFIKVPGTEEGLSAIEQLIEEGVNVNVTLLFGLERYQEVADAYMGGVEKRMEHGKKPSTVRSVASFFLSRIDVLVNKGLEEIANKGGDAAKSAEAIRGQTAVASAKAAYEIYQGIMASDRWQRLAAKGAHPQKLLWASTGKKISEDSDVKYVEPLIGKNTINTMPMKTLNAYREQGRPEARLEDNQGQARQILEQLAAVGVNLTEVTTQLEMEGVEKFIKPIDQLIETVTQKMKEV